MTAVVSPSSALAVMPPAHLIWGLRNSPGCRTLFQGGQDGWLRSSTFTSFMPLWLEGGHIKVPLRPETVRRTFKHQTVLSPKRKG